MRRLSVGSEDGRGSTSLRRFRIASMSTRRLVHRRDSRRAATDTTSARPAGQTIGTFPVMRDPRVLACAGVCRLSRSGLRFGPTLSNAFTLPEATCVCGACEILARSPFLADIDTFLCSACTVFLLEKKQQQRQHQRDAVGKNHGAAPAARRTRSTKRRRSPARSA